ncbi:major facilitator superfamily domain-containing protein 6-A [Tribolium madens]|uniref:major facilitator superfamily domain-containing protein 6-A n=1 Tax=Tribolium madens TaxID=41895 RepID=UPI001CF757FB|nr:major facilitator superfamily domain-containing protein 6-A [Tribolium madens]XP_044257867.1 major facilitator superfamily domain-containing protein 6-A [Tribolium madens]XP_044257868.1 major facilitator superfamily domain-containing protein 6-A [Tribolium madens]XP_044257869.1 major facilitator superfamily domain-containing protein 6-A [Tribolium madens]
MHVNKKFLPIKAHYFFFMAAMGPILPQLPVYGKELGISSVVMGTVTGILPFAFLFAKPLFGLLVDVYRDYRKTIFMMLILVMTICFTVMNFIPTRELLEMEFRNVSAVVDSCNVTEIASECTNRTTRVVCKSKCFTDNETSFLLTSDSKSQICALTKIPNYENSSKTCDIFCSNKDVEIYAGCLYKSISFWSFVILMSIGTIGFNVVNSISDAICFDVIGEDGDYGKQRVWGTIGFGLTALISGYVVNLFSENTVNYTPAFIIILVCSVIDIIACVKLELPVIPVPENIFKDLKKLLNNRYVVTFITFAIFAGILDGLIIYFLFWHLQELARTTNTSNVKLIEGLVVAAETLGGEVIFFSVAGKILDRFGHVHCFSMCFINYALRLGLISIAPSPWWIVPIEFFMQGPTYALTYTTIVAYANELAPPGASATMQGIAAGMDDGIGYAIGGILGGVLYEYVGSQHTLQIFSVFGLICSLSHLLLHKTVLRLKVPEKNAQSVEYKSPEEAYKATYEIS